MLTVPKDSANTKKEQESNLAKFRAVLFMKELETSLKNLDDKVWLSLKRNIWLNRKRCALPTFYLQ